MPVVLVTDSDHELADLFSRYLARAGHVVESASGGLECLDKLRQLRPDVLVLDRELLWGGSEGVLAYLREDWGSAAPLVVLTTGESQLFPERLGAPIVACLRKPFSLANLLKAIVAAPALTGIERAEIPEPATVC